MIKAKAEYGIRTCGLVLLTVAIPITLISDIFLIQNWLLWVFYILIILPWFIYIITWKLRINWIVKRNRGIKIGLSGLFTLLFLVVFFLADHQNIGIKTLMDWVLQIVKMGLLLICWDFSFSIIKKRKLIFISTGLLFCIISIIFLIFVSDVWNLVFFSLLFGIIGIILVLLGEFIMLRKGLLRYL